MLLSFLCLLLVKIAYSICLDDFKSHFIDSLPGLNEDLRSSHYSGYLNAGDGRQFFYWLVESESSMNDDPIIFWFNGGPGCSSLEGLLSENGPYLANNDGTLRTNPNSWTHFSSMVYIDSPEFVGFSYSDNFTYNEKFHYSDDNTTDANFEALKSFFDLHIRFRKNQVYLSGESYGSFYVSLLAERILKEKYDINLKGIIVGNGVVDEDLDMVTSLQYFYYHGFIDQPTMNGIIFDCKKLDTKQESVLCFQIEIYRLRESLKHVNLYSIFDPCDENQNDAFRCVSLSNATIYLNLREVQEKIHVSQHANPKWTICMEKLRLYSLEEQKAKKVIGTGNFSVYIQQYKSVKSALQQVIKHDIRLFFFYGDSDAICNFLTGQIVADYLGNKINGKHPWPNNNKIYGFLTTYDSHFFATILGAGHMAAQHKAIETASFVQAFLNNTLK